MIKCIVAHTILGAVLVALPIGLAQVDGLWHALAQVLLVVGGMTAFISVVIWAIVTVGDCWERK